MTDNSHLYNGSSPEKDVPVPLTSEASIREVAQQHEVNTVSQEALSSEIGATSIVGALDSVGFEGKRFPPEESIPSLFARGVKGPDSLHGHKYDKSNTVWTQVCIAEDLPRSELTYKQIELLDDVKRLEAYAPHTSGYMDIFTPAELHALVGKLDVFSQKNRPDFNLIESKIIDVVIRNRDSIDNDIVGIARRAEQNADGRRGMQWSTLNKLAGAANNALVANMFISDERRRYIVPIARDPEYDQKSAKSVNLKDVYQFVSTSHAYEIYGERSLGASEKRLRTFLENFEIITKWYDEAKFGIDQLPRDREFVDSLDNRISAHRKPARSGIQFMMAKLIGAMEKRCEGSEVFGKHKSYKADPAGAINLQLLIAHKVEAIRDKLGTGIHPADQEIIPLEDFDF